MVQGLDSEIGFKHCGQILVKVPAILTYIYLFLCCATATVFESVFFNRALHLICTSKSIWRALQQIWGKIQL